MRETFERYESRTGKDIPVLAVEISPDSSLAIASLTGGDIIYEEVRGGSRVRSGLTIVDANGDTVTGRNGDIVVSVTRASFMIFQKDYFLSKWILSPSKIR